ncbi:MAG: hypothetical protein GKR86_11680 [Ilumatobacter sp.]|nr:hypothetical protein [Ilumatobacter sp.]
MAVVNSKAQLGSLVFRVPFQNPALLAKSIAAIDHLSAGQFESGLWRRLALAQVARPRPRLPRGRRTIRPAKRVNGDHLSPARRRSTDDVRRRVLAHRQRHLRAGSV